MTMFEFMTNAFCLLCGVACIAVAFLIMYIALMVVFNGVKSRRRKEHGQNRD